MRGVLRKTCDVSAEVTLVAQSHHRFTRPCRLREALKGQMGKRRAAAMPPEEDPEHLAAIGEAVAAADAEDDLL